MKTFFRLFILAAIFTSCEDVEPTLYNGTPEEGTFLSFSRSVYSLPVERDATGNLEIVLNSSTVSSVDRVYNVEVIPSTSSSAANPATYSVPATVTIPAGEYQGILTIVGTDNNLVDEAVKNFQIRITNITTEYIDQNLASVNVFEVCPLESPFLGQYMVDQITSNFTPAGTTSIREGIVELVEGDTPYERVFSTEPYPGFGLEEFNFVISFQCDFVNMGERVDTGIGCTAGNTIKWKPTVDPVTYNTFNDTTFDVVFTEDSSSSCTDNPREVRIRFTKVN